MGGAKDYKGRKMSSRKTYITVADKIKMIPDAEVRRKIGKSIGEGYAKENPRFDWAKWYRACALLVE